MQALLDWLMDGRLMGLIIKETRQILRDKHLLFLLVFPPTIQLLLLGAALDPGVHNLKIGVVDYSHSAVSRELMTAVTANGLFRLDHYVPDEQHLDDDIQHARLSVGLVIPPDFENQLAHDHVAAVQVLIDGVDAYTAGVAKSYITQTIANFTPMGALHQPLVTPHLTMLYNPGLKSSWYFVPGVMGAMLTLTSTLVASAALLREKEFGTLEQLLMTPYEVWEILLAKVTPICALLMGDAFLAVLMGILVFGVPFRGSVLVFTLASALYVCVGIALGMMLATICRTERQAHLVSFFVNVPVMQLSGAVVPFETMPRLLRDLSSLDPLRYFTEIARSLLLKGSDMAALWPNLLILFVSAMILFGFSLLKFRRQLS